jgi:membrane associated rhomboid family serine protease
MLRPNGIQTFFALVVINAILGGLAVWLLARSDVNHTGCGSTIFTMFGYLILIGAVRRDVRSVLIAVIVFALYGGLLWALLPLRDRSLSWEGHLFGLMIGSVLGVYDASVSLYGSNNNNNNSQRVKSKDVDEKTRLTASEIDDEEDV